MVEKCAQNPSRVPGTRHAVRTFGQIRFNGTGSGLGTVTPTGTSCTRRNATIEYAAVTPPAMRNAHVQPDRAEHERQRHGGDEVADTAQRGRDGDDERVLARREVRGDEPDAR